MNLTDLKQVLDERSGDSAEQVLHRARLGGVRAKVLARRRRRIAVWTSAGVAAVVVTAVVVPGLRPHLPPTPAVTPAPTQLNEGFPEYTGGVRVVAARGASAPTRRVEVTMVPTTLDLVVLTRCAGFGQGISVERTVHVDGRAVADGTCRDGSLQPSDWAGLGVEVGRPVTFVLTLDSAWQSGEMGTVVVPIPRQGEFGIAVGERVPFEDYPLPSPPAGTLTPLAEAELPAGCTAARCPNVVIIRSTPDDPTRPVRLELTWRALGAAHMVSQTPGRLRLLVDDREVGTGEWWDYRATGLATYGDEDGVGRPTGDVDPDDPVVVEVLPEHVTGAWQVVLTPDPANVGG
ncbi:hypothetical protein [Micromonospora radicis]|uniref:Uncharacterized protein n=1 Tax=Micromonospora radicis TaxID=1894971 RepID=A0A418MXX6_9ACTN|nr:hypothetical protein [Micromonospora radicis]RIV39959.1 hypothetical protein D2L64_06355 [Micromonospora radicis]